MTDRPIIFSGPMIRALLDGSKTQTRRIIKDRGQMPEFCGGRYDDKNDPSNWGFEWHDHGSWITLDQFKTWRFVPIALGDRLWVRETHYLTDDGESEYAVYAADQDDVDEHLANMQTTMASHPRIDWSKHLRIRPSIHMPRWASRLTLTVTDVRVQRLQEISEADAVAEGCRPFFDENDTRIMHGPNGTPHEMSPLKGPVDAFQKLWDSLNAARAPWESNPWVAAYTFTVHRGNIDEVAQ